MEYVATGGVSNRGSPLEYRCTGEQAEVLPLSIRVPRNVLGAQPRHSFDYCVTGSYSLLGLGDIIIPGIMVAYCAAFDRIRAVRYHQYFAAASVGYAAGLMLSYVALITMQIAQPALLYLVPTTTISVLLVALIRKEVRPFWMGPEAAAAALIDSGLKPIAAGEDTSSAESS
ncbi:PREDICTED: signal peptide peptidase-like 2B [Rhagoletis zephyria]|uniref:signal peptide peptidase-like 2B n=1 Tax=Rhagoletis zephyria TaxID=28612 RepID=UPI0008119603|nr:PREDICTED: signal peptide peptidase-like 2B [Rhagoletis zephyria]